MKNAPSYNRAELTGAGFVGWGSLPQDEVRVKIKTAVKGKNQTRDERDTEVIRGPNYTPEQVGSIPSPRQIWYRLQLVKDKGRIVQPLLWGRHGFDGGSGIVGGMPSTIDSIIRWKTL